MVFLSMAFYTSSRTKIQHLNLPVNIANLIQKQYKYSLYARSFKEFEQEEINMKILFNNLLLDKELSSNQKNNIKDLNNYFNRKFSQKTNWAYCYRENITVNVNMSLERFHHELKNNSHRTEVHVLINLFIYI